MIMIIIFVICNSIVTIDLRPVLAALESLSLQFRGHPTSLPSTLDQLLSHSLDGWRWVHSCDLCSPSTSHIWACHILPITKYLYRMSNSMTDDVISYVQVTSSSEFHCSRFSSPCVLLSASFSTPQNKIETGTILLSVNGLIYILP